MRLTIDPAEFLEVLHPALESGDRDRVVAAVRSRWLPPQLCPLVQSPEPDVRRVAALVLGMVGDRRVTDCLARALRDPDETVHQMAEHARWSIWFRSGRPSAVKPFREGLEMLNQRAYQASIAWFREAFAADPDFSEAYNQIAIAHFFLRQWGESLEDCGQAVKLTPTHFGAIAGMGHCLMELGDLSRAFQCYRQSLTINPRMPAIASAVGRLQTSLRAVADEGEEFCLESMLA